MARGAKRGERVDLGFVVPERKERNTLLRAQRRAEIDSDALNRLKALQTVLEHEAALVDEAVVLAVRDQARTWTEVGDAFGLSRVSAFQRFAKRLGLTGINPPGQRPRQE